MKIFATINQLANHQYRTYLWN